MEAKPLLDWMPLQGTPWASQIDFLNNFVTYTTAICTIGITGVMLYFAVKYRRRSPEQETAYITHNATLETIWTVIPTLICIFVCFYGFFIYQDMRNPPAQALEIEVEGYQWGWNYKYPNGKSAGRDMVVPVGEPVRLIMRSKDVNHSFFVPAMRVKEDLMANEYHYMWFTPTLLGDFPIYCAEYCGLQHSAMLGTLKVVRQEEYQDFLTDRRKEDLPPEEFGKQQYTARGCNACHSLDGTTVIGPTFKGVFGKQVEFTDGTSATRDENYLRESILNSNKKIVKGFAPLMPAFEGQIKEDELAGLIAFIKAQQ